MTDKTDSTNDSTSESLTNSTVAPPVTIGMEGPRLPMPDSPEILAGPGPTPLEPNPSVATEAPKHEFAEEALTAMPAESETVRQPVPFEEFESLQKQYDELFDRLLRKQAEFENFRKRNEKEKREFLEYVLFHFAKDLLPVLDSLERSLNAPEGENVEDHKKGIELVLRQLREILSSVGLQPIRSLGRLFDPHQHQAMLKEENDRYAENEVIEELQRGYLFKDRLLRPSLVKVAVAPSSRVPIETPIETETQ